MKQIHKNISEVQKALRPFVTLNIPRVEGNVNQVLIEDLDTTSGIRHLIKKGHKKIMLVLGRSGGEHTRFLKNDFIHLIKQHNLKLNEDHILFGDYSSDTTYKVIKSALGKYPETTGICCMSDIMASSTVKAVQDSGKSVPKDISIIGRNNSLYSRLSTPQLSTIDLHMHEAGLSAANLILESLSGNIVSQKILMSGSLIERESVRNITKEGSILVDTLFINARI